MKDSDMLVPFLRGTSLLYWQNLLIPYCPDYFFWIDYIRANKN